MWAQPLSGTEGGAPAFWSPDSRTVAFGAEAKLKKIDASGGPVITLTDAPALRGGAWNELGTIVFAPTNANGSSLMRISSSGGLQTPATKLYPGEVRHRFPWFLPDGRHFLFEACAFSGDHVTIRIGSLDSLDSKVLVDANSHAIYANGYLLFLRRKTLMAQTFDAKRLELFGEPAPVAEHVQTAFNPNFALGLFSASANGFLAYRSGADAAIRRLTWIDRSGKPLSTIGGSGNLAMTQLSPDQKSAAVVAVEGTNQDIWIYDLTRGLRTRFTFDPGPDDNPVWSPDGRTIFFGSNRKGRMDLYRKAADGSGAEELLVADDVEKRPFSCSPDGRFLLYEAATPGATGNDIWVMPLTPRAKPYPLAASVFDDLNPQFSPDGRWVAYTSNESGRTELYVIPFRRLVSSPPANAKSPMRAVLCPVGGRMEKSSSIRSSTEP